MTLYGNTWRVSREPIHERLAPFGAINFKYDESLDLEAADTRKFVPPLELLTSLFRGHIEANLTSALERQREADISILMSTDSRLGGESLLRWLKPELLKMILDDHWGRILE
jgi:hypothetical protein